MTFEDHIFSFKVKNDTGKALSDFSNNASTMAKAVNDLIGAAKRAARSDYSSFAKQDAPSRGVHLGRLAAHGERGVAVDQNGPLGGVISNMLQLKRAADDLALAEAGLLGSLKLIFKEGGFTEGIREKINSAKSLIGGFIKGWLGPEVSLVFRTIGNSIAPLKHMFGAVFSQVNAVLGIAAILARTLAPVLSAISNMLSPVIMRLQDALIQLAMFLKPFIDTVMLGVQDVLVQLTSAFNGVGGAAQLLAPLMSLLKEIWAALVPAVSALFKGVVGLVSNAMPGLSAILGVVATSFRIIGGVVQGLAPALSAIGKLFTAVAIVLSSVLEPVMAVLEPIFTILASTIGDIIGIVGDTLSPILIILGMVIKAVLAPAAAILVPILKFIGLAIKAVLSPLQLMAQGWSLIGAALVAVQAPFNKYVKLISTSVSGLFQPILDWLRGMINKVRGWFRMAPIPGDRENAPPVIPQSPVASVIPVQRGFASRDISMRLSGGKVTPMDNRAPALVPGIDNAARSRVAAATTYVTDKTEDLAGDTIYQLKRVIAALEGGFERTVNHVDLLGTRVGGADQLLAMETW